MKMQFLLAGIVATGLFALAPYAVAHGGFGGGGGHGLRWIIRLLRSWLPGLQRSRTQWFSGQTSRRGIITKLLVDIAAAGNIN